jgi:hypothetical protein
MGPLNEVQPRRRYARKIVRGDTKEPLPVLAAADLLTRASDETARSHRVTTNRHR